MLQERCWYPPLDHVGDRQWHGSHSFPTLETPDPLDHVGYPSPRRTTNSAGELRLDFVTNSSWKIFWNDVPLKILIIMTIRIPPFSFKFKDVHRLTPGPPGDSLTTSGTRMCLTKWTTRLPPTRPEWKTRLPGEFLLFPGICSVAWNWLRFSDSNLFSNIVREDHELTLFKSNSMNH